MNQSNVLQKGIFIFALLAALAHFFNSWLGLIPPLQMRPLHVAVVCILVILPGYVAGKHLSNAFNTVLLVFAVVSTGYFMLHFDRIVRSAGYIHTEVVVAGALLVTVLIVLARRAMGNVLPIVAAIFVLYALFGDLLPSFLGHRGYSFSQVITFLYTNANGIFGVPIDVSVRYIVLFMIMAQFLQKSGATQLFNALARFVARRTIGGEAKASIVASGLFGSTSGTPIANVMVTGQITIPMMKRAGFPGYMAAGIESTASTGGLLMPPMMGAGAFIMAEILGTPYTTIMAAAIIPALLYFFSLYLAIDFFSRKKSITTKSVAEEEEEGNVSILSYLHTLLPLIIFFVVIFMGYSVFRAAVVAIILTPVICFFSKKTRFSIKDILDCFAEGMKKSVNIGLATAVAGIIVGVVALTGFGYIFAELLKTFGNFPFMALVITAGLCIILGMGMPAVATYIIIATLAAPVLIDLGFMPLAAHFFIFVFAAFSSVTPPVALSTYAAAGIAESDPWKSGYYGFLLASVAFLVPFVFIYSPELLGQASLDQLVIVLIMAICGVILYVGGVQGYFFGLVNKIYWRAIMIVSGVLFIIPGWETNMIAAALTLLVLLVGRVRQGTVKLSA